MRFLTTAAFSCLALLALSTSSSAATGHWYCTADGIKAWTTKADLTDATGYKYDGDRTSYSDGGKCTKG